MDNPRQSDHYSTDASSLPGKLYPNQFLVREDQFPRNDAREASLERDTAEMGELLPEPDALFTDDYWATIFAGDGFNIDDGIFLE